MSFEAFKAMIGDPILARLADYWGELRRGRLMPSWKDVDPVAVPTCLPHMWAWRYDRVGGTFTGILAGEEILAIGGKPMRGRDLIRDYIGIGSGSTIAARFRQVVEGPHLGHSIGRIFAESGHHGMGEWIVLPAASDGQHPDVIFGATRYLIQVGGLAPQAYRLIDDSEILSFTSLDPAGPPI